MTDTLSEYALKKSFPKNESDVLREQTEVIYIAKRAGINPLGQHVSCLEENYLEFFVRIGQVHLAQALLPRNLTHLRRRTNPLFRLLLENLEVSEKYNGMYARTKIENLKKKSPQAFRLWRQQNEKMVFRLFEQGIMPTDKDMLTRSVEIVLKQSPDFFDKLKQRQLYLIRRAQKPVDICRLIPQQEYI